MIEKMDDIIWYKSENGLTLIQFDHFNRTGLVEHGLTTRIGGFSKGSWTALNAGYMAGDQDEHVRENRRMISESMGMSLNDWINGGQRHTDCIEQVGVLDRGRGAYSAKTCFPATDGLMTNEAGVLLAVFYADCVPLLFLDPKKRAIAAVHAGWKGTAKHIGMKTVDKMKNAYGADPGDILVGIGPAIGPCCYEVDDPVIRSFEDGFSGPCLHPAQDPGKAFLDLWAANYQQLVCAGVLPEHIQTVRLCTSCHTEWFYSHRKEKGRTGRLAGVIALKKEA